MRLRYIEGGKEKLAAHERVIQSPQEHKGNWLTVFNKKQPLHVEFGGGKGGFIIGMAAQHPEINYLSFERCSKVLIKGISKMPEEDNKNFYLVHFHLQTASEVFENNELDRIYLNFSDPWPKDRHAKRRLTYRKYLETYSKVLKVGGELHFKTDNDDLFDFSLNELTEMGWEIKVMTKDLHNSSYVAGNIMTEYEKKFSEKGKNINKVIAVSPKK